jgi:hypothetical protein
MEPETDAVSAALRQTIEEPTLANARALQSVLTRKALIESTIGLIIQ